MISKQKTLPNSPAHDAHNKSRDKAYSDFKSKDFFNTFDFSNTRLDIIPPKHLSNFIKIVEEELRIEITRLCLMQYTRMQKTNNWTDVGQERILYSLTRLFQNISYDSPLSFVDITKTEKILTSESEKYLSLSAEELELAEKDIKVNLCYKKATLSSYKEINEFLEYLGSNKRMILGQLELYPSIIYGEVTVLSFSDFTVYEFKEELIHTPAIITSIAAMINDKEVIIREASAKTIFYNKWQDALLQINNSDLLDKITTPTENISLAIKLRALLAYGITNLEELNSKKELFIKEILDGLLWHEVGHGIVLHYFFDEEETAIDEALSVLGETSSSVMKEFLADWAPPIKDIYGPLYYMLNEDTQKTTRMMLVYFSDNWFLTTEDKFFKNHTEIMLSYVTKYFDNSCQINKNSFLKDLEPYFQNNLKRYKEVLSKVLYEIKISTYQINNQSLEFKDIINHYTSTLKNYMENYSAKEKKSFIYSRLLHNLENTAPQTAKKIKDILIKENHNYHKQLNNTAPNLNKNLIKQCKEKGLVLRTKPSLTSIWKKIPGVVNDFVNSIFDDNKTYTFSEISDTNILELFQKIMLAAKLTKKSNIDKQNIIQTYKDFINTNPISFSLLSSNNDIIDKNSFFRLIFLANLNTNPEELFLN